MESDRDARIRERAYAIWEREGQPHGRHAEHWMQAKAEIAAEEQAGGTAGPAAAQAGPGPAQPSPAAQQPPESGIRSEPVRVTRERGRETGDTQTPGSAGGGPLEPAETGQRRRRNRREGEPQS